MTVGASLVADAEPFELVEPTKGPLGNPSSLAQAGTVRDTTSGDLGSDAAGPGGKAVLVDVVATVAERPSGRCRGRPRRPRIRGIASSKGMS